ncbi:hypothetical protein RN053_14415 [Pantoea dispersa]|uniref:BRO family protein n=1 Tax=Pantoea dispersa TaxID=59814 RepID=UPI0028DF7E4D|nr:BRO family protein [Pantoea dispersa]MDT8851692.1 hypothetical protein [Pantoea dispersa]
MNELIFNNHSVMPFDNDNGKIWFTGEQLAELLDYADSKKISNIYNRHKDEFTESVTCILNVRTCSNNNEIHYIKVMAFSARGSHLIGMLSRTKVAKELCIWLLNLAEKESGIELGQLSITELASLTGQKFHNAIAGFDQKSFALRGQCGNGLMAQRKRDIRRVKEATRLALSLTQMVIPDLDEFSLEETS